MRKSLAASSVLLSLLATTTGAAFAQTSPAQIPPAQAPAVGQTPTPLSPPEEPVAPSQEPGPPAQPDIPTAPAAGRYPSADYILGDPGGVRSRLDDAGLKLSAGVTEDTAYNFQGGTRRNIYTAGQAAFAAVANMGKLVGLDGGTFTVNISQRWGRNLSDDVHLGVLQETQAIYGRGNITRLSELSYEQVFADGIISIKGGRLDMGADFNEFSCKFENLTFCYLTLDHIAGDNFFAYPVSMWAARLKIRVAPELWLKGGIYDINPELAQTGFSFNTSRSTGTNYMFEADWRPKLGGAGLPGIYHAGFGYSTADRADTLLDANGQPYMVTGLPPAMRRNYWVWWAQAQQQITGTSGDNPVGLTLFVNFTHTDDHVVRVNQVLNAGLFYSGMIPSRPLDEIGFAVGQSHVSDRYARGEELRDATPGLSFVPVRHSEYPMELYYGFSFGQAFTIRPNLQYIIHPGGTSANRDAVVAGLRTVLNF